MTGKHFVAVLVASMLFVACGNSSEEGPVSDPQELVARTVEAGCAMCIYEMEGVEKCTLAVKVDGQPYYVTGSTIFDHGDAHAADGICMTAREAVVDGKIEDGKVVATRLEFKPTAD